MSRITQKIKTLRKKILVIVSLFGKHDIPTMVVFRQLFSLCRYAVGQALAYSSVGRFIPFKVRNDYSLYLTKSPVAMVLFGDDLTMRDEEILALPLVKEGDVCVDIGCNIGNFSLFISKLVKNKGKIFAFEAHPKTYQYARNNFALNKVSNIMLEQKALGEKDGTVSFSNDNYDDVNHITKEGGLTVPMIRLDDYEPLYEVAKISCMKIDVEGYELFVLQGAVTVLKKTKHVLFEVYEESATGYGYHVEDVYDFFVVLGFSVLDPVTRTPFDRVNLKKDTIQNLLAVNTFL